VTSRNFHAEGFDEGTQAKLDIFQLYTREWLPVFLAKNPPYWTQIHIYDFFAGPGADPNGVEGSPVRIVRELLACQGNWVTNGITVHLHFYDDDADKTVALRKRLRPLLENVSNVLLDVQAIPFDKAYPKAIPILEDANAAKLVLLDPCGVNFFTDEVIQRFMTFKFTDWLFFLASSYLHRFRSVDSIKLKIGQPDDSHQIHRAVFEKFKALVPAAAKYYLAPFSIQKTPNIYGIIFGSANPLGMEKFLNTAWAKAPSNGEANFDIHREDFQRENPLLPFDGMHSKPTKLEEFEIDLRSAILTGKCPDEETIVEVCFDHGVRRQHAEPVIERLKKEKAISCEFRVPQLKGTRKVSVER
jgi:three-Cys-motif partner protein